MSRSRFTIHSTLQEMDECHDRIREARKIEERAYDQFTDTLIDMTYKYHDGWDNFRQSKARHYRKGDEQYYHQCARKRMKLDKQLRLLTIRLNKLQNVLLGTNSYKLFLINCIDGLDIDIINNIKILMIINNVNQYF